MPKAYEFCIPTRGNDVPHEINDSYRLHVERDGDRVRLITRSGYDRTSRRGIANKF
jgi:ATP-dependent DNA ligase